MNLHELSIADITKGLQRQSFSVSELVVDILDAIRHENAALGAYLSVFDHEAKSAAQNLDHALKSARQQNRKLPPLFAVPLAIKDNILIEGKPATAGSKMLENYTASYDATVITKLKKQGAIFLGKTNLDEFAMGSSTEHSAFGRTKNPHDASRVPGGSSGGSAAAVAAQLCAAALGSDTGGSIRQPAAFTGIVGLKPTYGSVSRNGLIAMASSLDQIGPMTKTVEDARTLFDAIRGGEDGLDSTTPAQTPHHTPHATFNMQHTCIGLPKEYFGDGLDPDIAAAVRAVALQLEKDGAHIEEISIPHASFALPVYYIIVSAEVSANLARFDGLRYGCHAPETQNLLEAYEQSRTHGFGREVKRRIMLGTYTLSAGYYDAYYLKAQKVRRLIRQDFENAFNTVDVILGPTTPTPAFRFGEKEDPLSMYLGDIYTVAVNLAGLPALSLPIGTVLRDNTPLPIGGQLIAPHGREDLLFALGTHIEAHAKHSRP